MMQSHGNPRPENAALILTGGGFPAALFEIGALVAWDEILGSVRPANSFDLYVGASAGSIVAALLALGIPPAELRRGALGEAYALLHIRPQDVFEAKSLPRVLGLTLRHSLRVLWHLRRSGAPLNRSTFLLGFQENLPAGFLSLKPLRSTLAGVMERLGRQDRFSDLPRSLLIPAFNLDTGRRAVFGAPGRAQVPVSGAVAASCAIPGIFEPVSVEGEDYIDGGTGEVCHVDLAIGGGARTIVLINPVVPVENDRKKVCFPGLNGSCSTLSEKGLFYVVEQAQRVSRSAKLEREMQCLPAEHPDSRFYLIQPHPHEAAAFLRSPISDRQKLQDLEFGYETARRFLESCREELARNLARPQNPERGDPSHSAGWRGLTRDR